jgi:protein SCO1/2
VALTFIYLRCPLPDFCPMMDRNFAAVQKAIKATPQLADVQLVSISFDPKHDTSAELKRHADALGADPRVWSFMTATETEIDTLTGRFGVFVERDAQNESNITHSLRTAVIDPEGRVVKVHSGTDWTPAQLVADLKAAPAPKR